MSWRDDEQQVERTFTSTHTAALRHVTVTPPLILPSLSPACCQFESELASLDINSLIAQKRQSTATATTAVSVTTPLSSSRLPYPSVPSSASFPGLPHHQRAHPPSNYVSPAFLPAAAVRYRQPAASTAAASRSSFPPTPHAVSSSASAAASNGAQSCYPASSHPPPAASAQRPTPTWINPQASSAPSASSSSSSSHLPGTFSSSSRPPPFRPPSAVPSRPPLSRSDYFHMKQQQQQRKRDKAAQRSLINKQRRAAQPPSSRRHRMQREGEAAFLDKQLTAYVLRELEVERGEREEVNWERWLSLQCLPDRVGVVGHSWYGEMLVACMQNVQEGKGPTEGTREYVGGKELRSGRTRKGKRSRGSRLQPSRDGDAQRQRKMKGCEESKEQTDMEPMAAANDGEDDDDDEEDIAIQSLLDRPSKRRRKTMLCDEDDGIDEALRDQSTADRDDTKSPPPPSSSTGALFSIQDSEAGFAQTAAKQRISAPCVIDAEMDEDDPIVLSACSAIADHTSSLPPPPRPPSPLLDFPADDDVKYEALPDADQFGDVDVDPVMQQLLSLFFIAADAAFDVHIVSDSTAAPGGQPLPTVSNLTTTVVSRTAPSRASHVSRQSPSPHSPLSSSASSASSLSSASPSTNVGLAVSGLPASPARPATSASATIATTPTRPPPLIVSPVSGGVSVADVTGWISAVERKALAEAKRRAWLKEQSEKAQPCTGGHTAASVAPLPLTTAVSDVIDLGAEVDEEDEDHPLRYPPVTAQPSASARPSLPVSSCADVSHHASAVPSSPFAAYRFPSIRGARKAELAVRCVNREGASAVWTEAESASSQRLIYPSPGVATQ